MTNNTNLNINELNLNNEMKLIKNRFNKVGINKNSTKWKVCISRQKPLYQKKNDIRDEFERDYTRILHSTAYRRLKHKTQVFPAPNNDHICTRIEHVNHVASVSHTITKFLGLNTQLATAIAIGHDVGHAPFGHAGEKALKEIVERELGEPFWHEKNSLRFIDKIETLQDIYGKESNLDLTYAVRDGIISHCGEVDENAIFPRDKMLDLNLIEEPNKYSPFTWEGCVVKISDKISYLGRDIEDALMLRILTQGQIRELRKIVQVPIKEINNTILMHDLIIDLCENSSPDSGIRFSQRHLDLLNMVKHFNYQNIYYHERLKDYRKYIELVINSIFDAYAKLYKKEKTIEELQKARILYPQFSKVFDEWLNKYSDVRNNMLSPSRYNNAILYSLNDKKDYSRAVIDYIAGMTDNFAISIFNELITF